MRKFFNKKGAAYIPFLAAVFFFFGWCGHEAKQNWKMPPTEKKTIKVEISYKVPAKPAPSDAFSDWEMFLF